MKMYKGIHPAQIEEIEKQLIDLEWYELIMKAREMGIAKEEIISFLSSTREISKTGSQSG